MRMLKRNGDHASTVFGIVGVNPWVSLMSFLTPTRIWRMWHTTHRFGHTLEAMKRIRTSNSVERIQST